ncbi:hypothetical protein [Streptomyces sp. MP131-18]|uniref:hypothetical protein n=1 Tax=Streptomyces sp. MP131-18 TaxID=1857892 RepID=UPI00097C3AAF|nr:hypothetical protein [Streptomyces sp. MP131-18]ONK09266.1 hypothetical protein STBA_71210 [Streptomyces sp. MP131-18]
MSEQMMTAERLVEVERLRASNAELERVSDEALAERDALHDRLDEMAAAVAPIEEIGEHSSHNDPWANALDLITPAAEVEQMRARVAELEAEADRLATDRARWMNRYYEESRTYWDAELPPGGECCADCGQPVESEPCPEHHPATVAERLRGRIAELERRPFGAEVLRMAAGETEKLRRFERVSGPRWAALSSEELREARLLEQRHQMDPLDGAFAELAIRHCSGTGINEPAGGGL